MRLACTLIQDAKGAWTLLHGPEVPWSDQRKALLAKSWKLPRGARKVVMFDNARTYLLAPEKTAE